MHNPFRSKQDRNQGIPQDGPPDYDTAISNDGSTGGGGGRGGPAPGGGGQNRNPFLSVTDPTGHSGAADSKNHGLHRTDSSASERSHIDTYKADRLMDDDHLRELDDEMRELPDGWVRCFDPKTQHHFYVEEATRRAIWVHPYDDPEFLSKLPDTHPANPNSREAKEARQQAEDEALAWRLHQEELQASGQDGNDQGGKGGAMSNDKGRSIGGGGDDKSFGSGPSPFRSNIPRSYSHPPETDDEALARRLQDEELEDSGLDKDDYSQSSGQGRQVGGYGDDKRFGSGPSPFRSPSARRTDSSNSAGFHEARSNPYESEPTPQEGRPWASYKDNGHQGHQHRNIFQRGKDKLIGSKEEREQHKEERRQQKEKEKELLREDYLKRRQELVDKQINDGTIGGGGYNSDPYAYAPPSSPFSRNYNTSYGYGYNGGYGRRYGYGPYGGYGGMGMYDTGLGYGGLGYGGFGYGGMGLGAGLLGGALLTDALIF